MRAGLDCTATTSGCSATCPTPRDTSARRPSAWCRPRGRRRSDCRRSSRCRTACRWSPRPWAGFRRSSSTARPAFSSRRATRMRIAQALVDPAHRPRAAGGDGRKGRRRDREDFGLEEEVDARLPDGRRGLRRSSDPVGSTRSHALERRRRVLHLIDTGGPGGAETIFFNLVTGLGAARLGVRAGGARRRLAGRGAARGGPRTAHADVESLVRPRLRGRDPAAGPRGAGGPHPDAPPRHCGVRHDRDVGLPDPRREHVPRRRGHPRHTGAQPAQAPPVGGREREARLRLRASASALPGHGRRRLAARRNACHPERDRLRRLRARACPTPFGASWAIPRIRTAGGRGRQHPRAEGLRQPPARLRASCGNRCRMPVWSWRDSRSPGSTRGCWS